MNRVYSFDAMSTIFFCEIVLWWNIFYAKREVDYLIVESLNENVEMAIDIYGKIFALWM